MLTSVHRAWLAAKDAEIAVWKAAYERAISTPPTYVPPAPPKPERPPSREPDEVDTAIEWKAQGDGGIRKYLAAYARAERRKGTDPKVLAEAILKGEGASDDNGVPED
jgi:hypothetical protein